MKALKHIVSTILFLFILASFCITTSADVAFSNAEIYRDHTSFTMVASNKGDTKNYPANSIEAIQSAARQGADIIKIDVECAENGELVLADGKENPSTLEAAFLLHINSLLMLDFDWQYRDKISNAVIENKMFENVIFYIDDAKADEIEAWKSTLPDNAMIMTYFKGNVIFAATSFIQNNALTSNGIQLATKVPYGVIFGNTVQDKAYLCGIRTMAAPCTPELCGKQIQDTAKWWDYLISCGFSIILTDDVRGLRTYVNTADAKSAELEKCIEQNITDWKLPNYSGDAFHDYKRAYTNAAETAQKLINQGYSRSCNDIDTAIYNLNTAKSNIEKNSESFENGTAGKKITPLTVFLSVAAIAVVITAEIYIYKKKKK